MSINQTANRIGCRRKTGVTGVTGLIASWKTYNKTNKDEDKAILKDSSGNGHHINLNNFTYTEGSGYEKGGLSFNGIDNYGNLYKPSRCDL